MRLWRRALWLDTPPGFMVACACYELEDPREFSLHAVLMHNLFATLAGGVACCTYLPARLMYGKDTGQGEVDNGAG